MKQAIVIVVLAVFVLAGVVSAQQTSPQPPQQTISNYTIYVFLQATSAPENKKAEDTFHKIVDDFQRFLKANRVAVAADISGRNWHSEAQIPLSQVLQTAKQAGAASVLYSTVTLPGKSVGVKTVAYALDGNTIWETSASCDMGGNVPLDVCLKVTLETLHEALKYRISQQDLPVMAAEQNPK
jgi:hypothetical protein